LIHAECTWGRSQRLAAKKLLVSLGYCCGSLAIAAARAAGSAVDAALQQ
jgi:hypothetical protein